MSPVFIALAIVLLLIPILPNLWSIWHVFHCDFPTPQEKMGWVAAAIFLPVLGGLLYIFWGRKRGTRVA